MSEAANLDHSWTSMVSLPIIRAILLEDDETDADLIVATLTQAGMPVECHRVDNELDFRAALASAPDLILSDYSLPGFDGLQALEIVLAAGLKTPFVIVSGAIGEDVAVGAIKMGAADYLLKDRLSRLPVAVAQALENARLRAIREAAEVEAERAYRQYELIVETAEEGIWLLDAKANTSFVNQKMSAMLGYEPAEMLGRSLFDFMDEKGRAIARVHVDRLRQGVKSKPVLMLSRRDGSELWTHMASNPVTTPDGSYAGALAMVSDITEQRRTQQELERLALHDALTGLPNRILFTDRLEQAMRSARRRRKGLSVVVFDLNRFKDVNDTFGHAAGDAVLAQMGRRISSQLRDSDTVARLGGDEFGVLLAECTEDESVATIHKLFPMLGRPIDLEGAAIDLGVSVGIARFPDHGTDADILMRRADAAMYTAKRTRSGFAVYQPGEEEAAHRQLALMSELGRAIREDELVLHYQPKVDLRSRTVWGFEALLRWRHPEFGMLQPDDFIPGAERTDLMPALTLWVLEHAIAQVRNWISAGRHFKVAVNFSPVSLHDYDLPATIRVLLEEAGVPPEFVLIEVTETATMLAAAGRTLNAIRGVGLGIAIDDFGTGYSSLTYLKDLPATELKIDKSFVINIANDPDDAAIVRPTVDLGHNLGLAVVAEGVESLAALNMVTEFGCDYAQGYYIAKPLPVEGIDAWIDESSWLVSAVDGVDAIEAEPEAVAERA